jgi:hypothetical protein
MSARLMATNPHTRRPAICEQCGRDFMARTDSAGRFCSRQCSGRWHSGQANGNFKGGLSKTKWWYHANKERHKAIQAKYDASPKGQATKARINSRRRAQQEHKEALLLLKEKENPELFSEIEALPRLRGAQAALRVSPPSR